MKSDPPSPPDYASAATAQGGANVETAIANNLMNRPTENTPYGSRNWTQTGTQQVGNYQIPTFQSDINFTPVGQELFDKTTNLQNGMADLGQNSLDNAQQALSGPFDITKNRDAIVDAMYKRSTRLLDPQYDQLADKQRTDLANRGFSVGSEGYQRAEDNFARQRDSAYGAARDQATTGGAQQAIQEALLQRTQPLQELNAIRTGAMPQSPTFQNYASSSAQPAPVFAGTQAQGNAATQNYGLETQNTNNQMQGLASLGSMAAMFFSDERLKSNVVKIGEMPRSGIGLYEYDKFGKRERGVMAQEIMDWKPEAVAEHPTGLLMVDYSKLGDA